MNLRYIEVFTSCKKILILFSDKLILELRIERGVLLRTIGHGQAGPVQAGLGSRPVAENK